jgi:hypothetical protein
VSIGKAMIPASSNPMSFFIPGFILPFVTSPGLFFDFEIVYRPDPKTTYSKRSNTIYFIDL